LNTYARQFLGVMDKPDVDIIEGLSPAIAIDQKTTSNNPRSTVGTVTEIYDYLRILYARIGHPHCPKCGREIARQSPEQIIDQVKNLIIQKLKTKSFARIFLLSPLVRGKKGEFTGLFENLMKKGFVKVRVDNQFFDLADDFALLKNNQHNIDVIVDRLGFTKKDLQEKGNQQGRLSEAIRSALTLSNGQAIVLDIDDASFEMPQNPKKTTDHLFSELFACPICNISFPEIEPRTFSFNSPFGACPKCNGIGALLRFEPQLVLNTNLSVSEGGINPMVKLYYQDTWFTRILKQAAKEEKIPLRKPLKQLSKDQIDKLLWGTGEKYYLVPGANRHGQETTIKEKFSGIIAELERRYQETDSDFIRQSLGQFMIYQKCPQCQGNRLKELALKITIDNKNISQLTALNIGQLQIFLNQISKNADLSEREKAIIEPILKEINARLKFLSSVGLNYLTLDRTTGTLAGGEAQRIRLASQIGTGLTGVLYVLDEPTIGLHSRDNSRLITTLKNLRDLGNTVVVVEHDRQIMEESDLVVDFGPGAGSRGGQIVAQGSPEKLKANPKSLTGQYLSGQKKIALQAKNNPQNGKALIIEGCREHNLKNINVSFPLNRLVCVTGVSGSGKSTLINETLYPALIKALGKISKEAPGQYENLKGADQVARAYLVDQSPIGRTPRSNPATYTGIFTDIRELFAQTPEAKIRGYNLGQFSFNTRGGRCEACSGHGQLKIEMQFLPDVYVKCEVCQGKRYNTDTLEILYKDKNIAHVLDMTIDEAQEFFQNIPSISKKLAVLVQVGLGYLKLGQPAPTLSGGEAQRIKIAHELVKQSPEHTLYILDEPTTGLHFADLEKLINILRQLVNNNNTVIVIEHNLDLIKNADWIIDLGPEGGEEGGKIVAQGNVNSLTQNPQSYTGQFLKKVLSDKLNWAINP
ncbi:MAG: excinuclease ABC subunit UvrA, partial [Candidatus Shapirobacteria bacterium]|nr:excinuclease ABC subunit UvrA [Candidatus Shapirobacteria bacterium]MDD5481884.1 excinuclease ABC subunit UvrA [Candidatus Shapirobacteria bacterium]